jgi:hypothetical protein
VRLSAFLRSENVVEGAGLWMRVDGVFGRLAFDGMTDRLVRGTTAWRRHQLVLDVPDESTVISFGLMLMGDLRGKVWIDDTKLEVVTRDEPLTQSASAPTSSVLESFPERPVNLGLEL